MCNRNYILPHADKNVGLIWMEVVILKCAQLNEVELQQFPASVKSGKMYWIGRPRDSETYWIPLENVLSSILIFWEFG